MVSTKAPIDSACGHHDARNLPTELLFQCRAPRHELEAEPIIDHRETSGTQCDALTVDSGDVLALCRRVIAQAGLC